MSGSPGDRHGQGERKSLFHFAYHRSPDQEAATPVRHPVLVVGAGPVGLSAAIDLALRGLPVVVLDDADRIGEGSRAICFAKRTLEIWDRLGVAAPMVEKGVTWKLGKVFFRDQMVYQFDLLPEDGHKMPAFINLQQYYAEHALVSRAEALPNLEIRWLNRVGNVRPLDHGVRVDIETPDGPYAIEADWLVAADGARSSVRRCLGLEFVGQAFEDHFLIADVKMQADYPTERWFWFEPPFHTGQSALLHRQPENVWRIDLQLGPEADPDEEKRPERVIPRLKRMLGDRRFELEWVSVYMFQCRRLERFVHGRVIFAGDAAHLVSPFGARGANSGVQDAENLAWKLALVLRGEAPDSLLETYDLERTAAADENIGHSMRSTEFIAPRSPTEHLFRNAVLDLARRTEFAKRMVNSGRLSTASTYTTPLSTPDEDDWGGQARLGAPLPDAPVTDARGEPHWLLNRLSPGFNLLYVKDGARPNVPAGVALVVIGEDLRDETGHFTRRFDARPGSAYLVRPDQHLAARFRTLDRAKVEAALARAMGRG
ncbi:MAG: FAD-dependent oxidoreductase [Pseudomonadota bacterium]|nr:FAD-dependent oxidoreductase [Pseudomonadota bacterium]